jgi:hypothetical protein
MLFQEPEATVLLTRQDTTPSFTILVSDLELRFKIKERGPVPYSENAFGVILIGRDFPYEKGRELIIVAKRNYYRGIRYIALYDQVKSRPTEKENLALHIGLPTEIAVENNLKAWKEEEIEGLSGVTSQKEFIDRIMNR